MKRRFTGWHMATILIAFFGVVIAVNLVMARYAVSTFNGVVVENSYVASQNYNDWLSEANRGAELGWSADIARGSGDHLVVQLNGAPESASLMARARRPLKGGEGELVRFTRAEDGSYVSQQTLAPGRWLIRLEAKAGSDVWRTQEELQ